MQYSLEKQIEVLNFELEYERELTEAVVDMYQQKMPILAQNIRLQEKLRQENNIEGSDSFDDDTLLRPTGEESEIRSQYEESPNFARMVNRTNPSSKTRPSKHNSPYWKRKRNTLFE